MTDEEFKAVIVKALEKMTPADVADKVQVSVPTVKRWAAGLNSPHPFMRPAIKRILEAK